MPHRKKLFWFAVLLLSAVAVHLYSMDPSRVENGYSRVLFPRIAGFLRAIFGWLPFSIGDIMYGAAAFFLIMLLIRFSKWLFRFRKNNLAPHFLRGAGSLLTVCSIIYILFNLFWGINYNRVGIAGQLNLEIKKYSVEELKTINAVLVEKVNFSKRSLLWSKTAYPGNKELFAMTTRAYETVAKQYPFLTYRRVSIKPSLWSWVGNYTGFLGYYNPFTGEAQVNTTVSKFTQPFTACHETAHQLGYAKEMEANFVGYLAAAASKDTLFHYSVYTDLFTYANRTLYFADSSAAQLYRKMLLPEVIADFKERREFNLAHRSFLEPVFRGIYGVFLKSNQQPMGMLSYDEVTGFIIAYYKKFGKI
ncbi:MAG: DUF3810 domain-containing protein [Ferruginibacter sp.]